MKTPSMRDGGRGGLVDQHAGAEPVERERRGDGVGLAGGDEMGEDVAGGES